MSDADLKGLAYRLYDRRDEGRLVERVAVDVDGWKPANGMCHHNAEFYVSKVPGCKVVRGWIMADYSDDVRFFAHSMVETPQGELMDITPNPLAWSYSFTRHEDSSFDVTLTAIDHIVFDSPHRLTLR